MAEKIIKIATRNSPLALWQARYVQQRLQLITPHVPIQLVPIVTEGDKIINISLAKIGGKGLFIKELEKALLEGRADMAVHSMKDIPVDFPPGLGLAAVGQREDPRDAFVSNRFTSLQHLPHGAIVGTSSLRRQCQLYACRPDLRVRLLRGNLATRLAKLDAGDYDAIILAAAGLIRLNLQERISAFFSTDCLLPAVGQGAIGIECRLDDITLFDQLQSLNHAASMLCINAERAMNRHLQGGCQIPIGAFAQIEGERLRLRGLVGSPDGSRLVRGEQCGPAHAAETIGTALAKTLLAQGARAILDNLSA